MSYKSRLKRAQDMDNVYVSEDANPTIKSQKADIRAVTKLAIQEGKEVTPKGRGLIYQGRYYHHSVLADLPHCIRLENTRTRIGVDFIAYHGPLSPYSNLYNCRIEIDGIKYHSVEQALSAEKCCLADAHATLDQVMATSDPYECMRKVKGITLPGWQETAEDLLFKYNVAKFEQNKGLRAILLKPDRVNKALIESTSNPVWGTQCSIHSRRLTTRGFKGRNRGGKILERVCDHLKAL